MLHWGGGYGWAPESFMNLPTNATHLDCFWRGQETLEYLDADPFVLFGIDDPLTQQALKELTSWLGVDGKEFF